MVRRRSTPLAPVLAPGPTGEVDSLKRGLELLRQFTIDRTTLSLEEIAARTGVPRPTVQRLAGTLGAFGFLRAVPGTDRFEPDVGCLALGHAVRIALPLFQAAHPLLQEFAVRERTKVRLTVRDRLQALSLDSAGGEQVGALSPLASCAAGHAMLWATEAPLQGELLRRIREESPTALGTIYKSFQQLEECGACRFGEPIATATSITLAGDVAAYAIEAPVVKAESLVALAAEIRARVQSEGTGTA